MILCLPCGLLELLHLPSTLCFSFPPPTWYPGDRAGENDSEHGHHLSIATEPCVFCTHLPQGSLLSVMQWSKVSCVLVKRSLRLQELSALLSLAPGLSAALESLCTWRKQKHFLLRNSFALSAGELRRGRARRRHGERAHKRRDSNAAKRSSCALETSGPSSFVPWNSLPTLAVHRFFLGISPHQSITHFRVVALNPEIWVRRESGCRVRNQQWRTSSLQCTLVNAPVPHLGIRA